ncbi:tyrosine-type recombinase/integrase [Haloterrigena sp. SYSU A558-1]|uniref:Tyrosine-type recombinase/integrase n=1 Tax=Haloterrigena gelatinilytica TaxID=2741724 RepID=A0ABX2LEP1_9EURY|nr:tyrosine-type recombinase/integrase [Haloterrigena gelatinilytica]NUC74727.1 tyrosine-type recombinase/integrase [Haloterrigena gelatinilytica]
MGDEWYETVFENRCSEVNEFLERKRDLGRSPRTLNEYSRTLQKFFHDEFPELEPGEVTVRHIEQYLSALTRRDLSQNTKRRYLESLSAFYSWAMKRPRYAEITGNPAAVVLEELPKRVRDRPDCATWENGRAIVHGLQEPRLKLVAIVMAKTGARVSEVVTLEQDDLLLDDGFIRFRNRKGKATTVFPIDTETRDALERYRLVWKGRDTEYVFPSIRGEHLSREQVRRRIREAAVKASVMEEDEHRFEKKFTPHTYRTVFTTEMRNAGMKDHILRYLRGDKDSEAMDVYTRVDRETAKEAYLDCIRELNL